MRPSPKPPRASARAGWRSSCTSRCSTATSGETEITGRFVNPAPRRRWSRRWAALCRRWSPAATSISIADATAGSRHVWGTSTAFVLPDRLQPRYGIKEVGYVEHRLEPDGTHDSRLVQVAGVPTLNIADFPGAYGPI